VGLSASLMDIEVVLARISHRRVVLL